MFMTPISLSSRRSILTYTSTSEEAAAAALKDAPKLRSSVDRHVARNVYINPDLAPAAAKLADEARKNQRELKRPQQNNDTAIATSLVSQFANALSSRNSAMVVETTDVPQPNNNNIGSSCLYSNDQGHLQASARAPTVATAASENILGSDIGLSWINEAAGGGSRLPSLSSSSPSAGRNSSPTDHTAVLCSPSWRNY